MLIDFKPWHMELIRLPASARTMVDKSDRLLGNLAALADARLAFTIVGDEDGDVCILGVAAALPTSADGCIGEVFIIPSQEKYQHRIEFAKSAKRILARARERFAIIEAIGEDTPFFTRWFTWLGFERHGSVERPGVDGSRAFWRLAGEGA